MSGGKGQFNYYFQTTFYDWYINNGKLWPKLKPICCSMPHVNFVNDIFDLIIIWACCNTAKQSEHFII